MAKPDIDTLQTHLEALVGERNPFTSPRALHTAGEYVEAQFESYGLRVWREPVPFEGQSFFNVFGQTAGANPNAGTFIVGAHFDTVENTPGADDNASAVAALLEVARCLAATDLPVPLLFTGFTLEEHGFVGSRHLVDRLDRDGVPVAGMISLEMLGFRNQEPESQTFPPYVDAGQYPDTGDFIAVVGNEVSRTLTEKLSESLQSVSGLKVEHLVVPGRGGDFRDVQLSDHSPFWEAGHKAVMVTDTAFFRNPNYHQPSDTLETLDVAFIRDVSEGLAAYLRDPQA